MDHGKRENLHHATRYPQENEMGLHPRTQMGRNDGHGKGKIHLIQTKKESGGKINVLQAMGGNVQEMQCGTTGRKQKPLDQRPPGKPEKRTERFNNV